MAKSDVYGTEYVSAGYRVPAVVHETTSEQIALVVAPVPERREVQVAEHLFEDFWKTYACGSRVFGVRRHRERVNGRVLVKDVRKNWN